jgi:hypothetical protein
MCSIKALNGIVLLGASPETADHVFSSFLALISQTLEAVRRCFCQPFAPQLRGSAFVHETDQSMTCQLLSHVICLKISCTADSS